MLTSRRVLKTVFCLSLLLWVAALFLTRSMPAPAELKRELQTEPLQTPTDAPTFEIEKNGVTYVIEPLFDYDLSGLVVSYHHSNAWFDYYHQEWQDYLNLEDLCVIWGDNASSGLYSQMTFKNKSFSCWVSSKRGVTSEQWSQFREEQWSNNHLLVNDRELEKRMLSVRDGDQIRLRGYLAKYSIKGGTFERSSSTTRTDTAMGACETVFVQEFQILQRAHPFWQDLGDYVRYAVLLSLLALLLDYWRADPLASALTKPPEPEARLYDVKIETKKTGD